MIRGGGTAAVDFPGELIVQDVRCLHGRQRGRLRPITLLVGENSTGKTTFLGCCGVLHQVLSGWDLGRAPDFNREPFAMGSFRDIVRSRRGPAGRIDAFRIGMAINPAPNRGMPPYTALATFAEAGSQPVVSSLRFEFGSEAFLELKREKQKGGRDPIVVQVPGHAVPTDIPFDEAGFLMEHLISLAAEDRTSPGAQRALRPVTEYLRDLLTGGKPRRSTGRFRLRPLPALVPVAPLRSKPVRTYNPVSEAASPEGDHVPMLMMRLNRTDRSHWNSLHDDLVAFGREAGLFSDIKVRRHGAQMSDPFQLQVKVRSGPHSNIMDVGYGVSQSLPILVNVLEADESGSARRGARPGGRMFLLQQPEVHLHPRGQAELATLFVEAYRKNGNHFVIETHSDYIVDRVRLAVRRRQLERDDVSILYFEPKGNAVTIHNLTLDEQGNLQGAPAGYRDFFMKETDRLLGFAD